MTSAKNSKEKQRLTHLFSASCVHIDHTLILYIFEKEKQFSFSLDKQSLSLLIKQDLKKYTPFLLLSLFAVVR